MSNPGHATINGERVYYLYTAPKNQTELEHELRVLRDFLAAWNNDSEVEDIFPQSLNVFNLLPDPRITLTRPQTAHDAQRSGLQRRRHPPKPQGLSSRRYQNQIWINIIAYVNLPAPLITNQRMQAPLLRQSI